MSLFCSFNEVEQVADDAESDSLPEPAPSVPSDEPKSSAPPSPSPEKEETETAEKAEEKKETAEKDIDLVPPPVPKRSKRTPAKKATAADSRKQLRAISTPNRNSVAGKNLTFMEKSTDLSAIPILSPPSTRKRKRDSTSSAQEARQKSSEEDVSKCSIR